MIKSNQIQVEYLPTKEMIADKPTSTIAFQKCRTAIVFPGFEGASNQVTSSCATQTVGKYRLDCLRLIAMQEWEALARCCYTNVLSRKNLQIETTSKSNTNSNSKNATG
uniref:Uncharacterized protein n=1 Tax=Spongospora subterranea TaxID=70186 RepID=A0A0H5QL87_9EUKA|eukprot:CRZ02885.1 hypothetical protein [Spongospora subterranea]